MPFGIRFSMWILGATLALVLGVMGYCATQPG
jgi:hypothetical protein